MDAKLKLLIGGSLLVTLGTFFLVGPIEQPDVYHKFADTNRHLGVPNFANVVSNLAYLIPGLMGLLLVNGTFSDRSRFIDPREALPFYLVFAGSVLLAFGSGYYHLDPVDETLVADRMTMTVGFMAVLGFMIAERVSVDWGLKLLPGLLAVGLFSTVYWFYTELEGAGDLRLYGLVQFLPLVAIAVMLLGFRARYDRVKYVWLALGSYGAAKLFEQLDHQIWDLSAHLVSGHTLKHLVSGLGIYYLVLYVRDRNPAP